MLRNNSQWVEDEKYQNARKTHKKIMLESLRSFYHCLKIIRLQYCETQTLVFILKFQEKFKIDQQNTRRVCYQPFFHHFTLWQDFSRIFLILFDQKTKKIKWKFGIFFSSISKRGASGFSVPIHKNKRRFLTILIFFPPQ